MFNRLPRRVLVAAGVAILSLVQVPAQAAKPAGPSKPGPLAWNNCDQTWATDTDLMSVQARFSRAGELRRVEVDGCAGEWISFSIQNSNYPNPGSYGRVHLAPGQNLTWDHAQLAAHNMPVTKVGANSFDIHLDDAPYGWCVQDNSNIWVVWPDGSITPYPHC